jgi:molybdenum cofactor cytidylyltransferase
LNKPSDHFPVAAIILAAGEARRMGELKQLLPFGNGTLLSHAIDTATASGFDPIIVVVGADASAVQASVASKRIEIVRNPKWQTGMGSSISAGVRRLSELGAESAAVAVLLGDQPLVTPRHLQEMRGLLNAAGGYSIVAAQYSGKPGVPAFFRRHLFSRLASLEPEAGAKTLLLDTELKVTHYPLPEAAVDIDTPADFAALRESGPI